MRSKSIGAIAASLMARPGGAAAAVIDPYWTNVVYLKTSEGTVEGARAPGQCSDSIASDMCGSDANSMRLRAAVKLPWTSFSIKNEGGTGSKFVADDFSNAITLGAQQFTLECWRSRTTRGSWLFRKSGASGNFGWTFGVDDSLANPTERLYFQWSTDGTTVTTFYVPSGYIVDANWHHCAVDRDEFNVLRMYVDGAMVGKTTVGTIFNVSYPCYMACNQSGHSDANYYDDVRATVGVARYKSDAGFSPPIARVKKGGAGDPFWDYVVAYQRFNGGYNDDRTLDQSGNHFDMDYATLNGFTSTADKFGQVGYMSYGLNGVYGGASRLSNKVDIYNKNWTIEFQLYPIDAGVDKSICGVWDATQGKQWRFRVNADNTVSFDLMGTDGVTVTSFSTNSGALTGAAFTAATQTRVNAAAWNFIVAEMSGPRLKVWMRGVKVIDAAVVPTSIYNLTANGKTGRLYFNGVDSGSNNANSGLKSKYDDFRLTVGVARYQEQATDPIASPQTAQFPSYKTAIVIASNIVLDEGGFATRSEDGTMIEEG